MVHDYGGISEALSCLNALAASQTPAILRSTECSAVWAKNIDCEEELLIMCQIESEEAVQKISDIAIVDGLDYIMIGSTDLSANMGYIRDLGKENAVKMVQTVEKAVLGMEPKGDIRVYLVRFAMPHDEPSELKKRGYHVVCDAVDFVLYRDAIVKDVLKFKTV